MYRILLFVSLSIPFTSCSDDGGFTTEETFDDDETTDSQMDEPKKGSSLHCCKKKLSGECACLDYHWDCRLCRPKASKPKPASSDEVNDETFCSPE